MRVIHVLRKPLSEGTVAANTLKHGTGGLNIDASRIAGEVPEVTGQGFRSGKYGGQIGWGEPTLSGVPSNPSSGGRWPANVILQHLDGCRCDGVKRVKSAGWKDTDIHKGGKGVADNFGATGITGRHYADEDGQETVANWICEPGCPVARLDEQSGVLPKAGNKRPSAIRTNNTGVYGTWGEQMRNPNMYGDAGGASRFYKQVGGKTNG